MHWLRSASERHADFKSARLTGNAFEHIKSEIERWSKVVKEAKIPMN